MLIVVPSQALDVREIHFHKGGGGQMVKRRQDSEYRRGRRAQQSWPSLLAIVQETWFRLDQRTRRLFSVLTYCDFHLRTPRRLLGRGCLWTMRRMRILSFLPLQPLLPLVLVMLVLKLPASF